MLSKSYDFVIIGGGTAGLVLANRLTENSNINVLVLEAGQSKLEDPKINIPALFAQLYEDPQYDWCFKSTPQHGLNNRIIAQPRGKILGGSSAINFLMASHAAASELDHWEELRNPGWNWEALLPYYRKSEGFIPPTDEQKSLYGTGGFDSRLYGSDGPIKLTMPIGTGKSDASWQPTLQALGIHTDLDPRVRNSLGAWPLLKLTDSAGKRSYAATAYYVPVAERTNLTILTNALVTKVLLKPPTELRGLAKATGVSFSIDGVEQMVSAAKEVLLAGGTYMNVIVDNPAVGENLQDHFMVPLNIRAKEGVMGAESFRDPKILDWAMSEWISGRGGPLSSGVNGTAFLSSQIIAPHVGQPSNFMKSVGLDRDDAQSAFLRKLLASDNEADLQFCFAPIGWNPYAGGEALSRLFAHSNPGNYFAFTAILEHPFSKGAVQIVSSDPRIAPAINPKYLDHPADFELMVQGVLFMQKIYETKPLADYCQDLDDGSGKKIQDTYKIPGRIDRKAAEKLVREGTIPAWHTVGTCAMLPKQRGGVVDLQLKVYGVDSLRVVDASVMPTLVRGNITSAVYAIAEKAADLIKADYKL